MTSTIFSFSFKTKIIPFHETMVELTTDVIIALVVIAVVIILILLTLLICCLCRKCEQCAQWSRRTASDREDRSRQAALAESRREFDEIRAQHNTLRDEIRVKYNLNNGENSNATVIHSC